MSIFAIVMTALLVISLIAWAVRRHLTWGAVSAFLAMAIAVDFGWLDWWVAFWFTIALLAGWVSYLFWSGVLLVITILVITTLIGIGSYSSWGPFLGNLANSTRSSISDADSTPPPTDPACPVQYQQVETKHDNNNVDAEFQLAYAGATTNVADLSVAQRDLVLDRAGKSAEVLNAWANAAYLRDTGDWKPLYDEGTNCLSPEGQKLHSAMDVLFHSPDTKFEEVPSVPDGSFNSAITSDGTGTFGVDSVAGVRGDTRSIKITHSGGKETYIMIRCGNPVFPGKPTHLPEVPTDNPPVETPPQETPPTDTHTTPPPPPVDDAKDQSLNVGSPGGHWEPLGTGPVTTGNESEQQQSSGQTGGNVTDNSVPEGTGAGDTTSDTGPQVVVGGATSAPPAVEDTSDDVVDPGVIVQDPGGTEGAVEIAPPAD